MAQKKDWNGKRVVILGGARQGQAAARWLAHHGAIVTVNDRRSAAEMSAARSALANSSVNWVLGSHPLELLDQTDILCISGGVPLDNPLVAGAMEHGIPLTNDTQIFMEVAPCRTVGITGSAGKTTTTTLVGQMAKKADADKTFVGGNIGDPLLNYVDGMAPETLAILEISSFQLEQMTVSPDVAAILNITPNHLDRHGTMDAYTSAKRRILEFQRADGIAILNRDDAGSWNLVRNVNGRLVSFGAGAFSGKQDGTFLADDTLHLRQRGLEIPLVRRDQIQLRGAHNLMNVLAAFAIGYAASIPLKAMISAAEEFHGVAHRLEYVREWHGAQWYNDSIATAPERTLAAINSFNEPIVLLLGGLDKNLPWEDLAGVVRQRVEHVVIFGEAAEKISSALDRAVGPLPLSVSRCKDLHEAVLAAAQVASPGSIVLLSPGGTSFDQFYDFEERGKAFRKWVSELS
ncbi:MAG: UDP-N-acetylmuramoyl-L-alanine--D-glutamate ligase [Anaerolineales bacterium]|jgi:UDP-N-acetylmuramoylalanine--D-glutamate ligase